MRLKPTPSPLTLRAHRSLSLEQPRTDLKYSQSFMQLLQKAMQHLQAKTEAKSRRKLSHQLPQIQRESQFYQTFVQPVTLAQPKKLPTRVRKTARLSMPVVTCREIQPSNPRKNSTLTTTDNVTQNLAEAEPPARHTGPITKIVTLRKHKHARRQYMTRRESAERGAEQGHGGEGSGMGVRWGRRPDGGCQMQGRRGECLEPWQIGEEQEGHIF